MEERSAVEQIDSIISTSGGWKAETLARLRAVIKAADPDVTEEVKWKMATRPEGLPVWSHNGMVCFAETWKDNIKLLFPKGAALKDPNNLFNARLKSHDIRAIEFHDGDTVDRAALRALILEAVAHNDKKKTR